MKRSMKKPFLVCLMLMMASVAFAQDAAYLIKEYRKVKGAKYENIGKSLKKQTKKLRYIDPKQDEVVQRIDKAEAVKVKLTVPQREALTENILDIEGYEILYQEKNNVGSIFSSEWSLFKDRKYFVKEENGRIKEAFVCVDAIDKNHIVTCIFYIKGDFSADELMEMVEFEESKSTVIK